MGNPLPAEIFTLYTESNGLQKLLTYFLDSLPSSLHGITLRSISSLLTGRHEFLCCLAHMFLGNRLCHYLLECVFCQCDIRPRQCGTYCYQQFSKDYRCSSGFGFEERQRRRRGEGKKSFLSPEQTRGFALILIPSEKNKRGTEYARLRTGETATSASFSSFFPSSFPPSEQKSISC